MSRTTRRKGYELTLNNSWNNHGFKTNGYYTTWDRTVCTGNGHGGVKQHRAMTPREVYDQDHVRYGESKHANAYGPNEYYRYLYKLILDHHNAKQLRKHLSSVGEYDPVFLAKGKSRGDCWNW
jgi:hypothetical protein